MRALVGLCFVAGVISSAAGQTQAADDAGPVATLHVSTTLVEIPLLILNHRGELPSPALPAESIEIKLGDGQWFRPSYVRPEGQDPIDLAILLDLNSPVTDLPRPLAQALSSLSSLSLTPRDHVSLFVMDCASVRVTSIPADLAQAGDVVKSAIEPLEQSGAKNTCKEGGHLWDTLAAVTRTLERAHSRRVILAITAGKDRGSVVTSESLMQRAQDSAVTIFDLDPTYRPFGDPHVQGLPSIAASSGGLRLGLEPGSLRETVRSITAMLRGRYIAAFRLPSDAKAGNIQIAARVTALPLDAYSVHITGNWVPLPNPGGAGDTSSQTMQANAAPVLQPSERVVAGASQQTEASSVPTPATAARSEPAVNTAQVALPGVLAQVDQHPPSGEAAAVQPQPTSASDASVTTLKVNTRLTLVDVTVTDAKGHPVHGLTQADFTVKEDGKPQPIKNFEELGSERPTEAPPPNVYSNRQTANAGAANILLLDMVTLGIVDDFMHRPAAFKDAKEASLNFLKTMPDGTRVAVMEMDGSGLHTLQGFTTDRELLLAAVNSATYQRVPESKWDPPLPPTPGVPSEKPNFTMLCNAMNFQSAQALNALNQMTLFVSGVAGRKNLMWFTVGVPWLTNYEPVSRSPNLACVSDFTPQLQAVYGRLTAERVALYPINPVGVAAEGNLSGANDALGDLAKATGGKAHFDNDFVGALREDTAIGADYYALSYVPPLSKYDGKYHKIEVTVDRPGVQLEYRRGYTSLDINGPVIESKKDHGKPAPPKSSFQTAMGYGAIPATQLTFEVRAVPSPGPSKPGVIGSLNPELKGKPLVRYSFAFDLPRDRITLEAQPDGSSKASFEVGIAAYDVQGRVLNSLDERRGFTLKPDAVAGFLQKPFIVPMEIDLPAGALTVHAGLLDQPSQAMGVVEIPLAVKAP